jgi:hypothetical protein
MRAQSDEADVDLEAQLPGGIDHDGRHGTLLPTEDDLAELLAERMAYYRARAVEYDATYPLDDRAGVEARARLVAALEALEALAPTGGCSSWRAAPASGPRSSPATRRQ